MKYRILKSNGIEIKLSREKDFGPSIEADKKTLFCLYQHGMWRWITGDRHKKVDYDGDGYVKIVGVDMED
jgi:hypothetical protein